MLEQLLQEYVQKMVDEAVEKRVSCLVEEIENLNHRLEDTVTSENVVDAVIEALERASFDVRVR